MREEPIVILLAEDDPDHVELIRRGLQHDPVASRVMHVSDGEAALDYLFRRGAYSIEALSPRPHIVLLDLRLPKVDGLDVLRQVKESSLGGLPIIILSTSDATSDVARAYELRANSYLVKPLDFSSFSAMLQSLGLFWLRWNEPLR